MDICECGHSLMKHDLDGCVLCPCRKFVSGDFDEEDDDQK